MPKERFIALDESSPEMAYPSPAKASEPYYPTAHLPKTIKGLDEVGKVKIVRVKVRVQSIEKRKNGRNCTGLELLGIRIEGE